MFVLYFLFTYFIHIHDCECILTRLYFILIILPFCCLSFREWVFYTPYTESIHRRPYGSATFRGWAQQPPCLSVRTGMQMMRRGPGPASRVPARHPIRIPIYSRAESLASLARHPFLPSNKMEMSPLLTREAWTRREVRCPGTLLLSPRNSKSSVLARVTYVCI